MSAITLRLSADTEQKLRDKARKLGLTIEIYLQQLAQRVAEDGTISGPTHLDTNGSSTTAQSESEGFPKFISRPELTADERETLLDQFSAPPSGKVLPPDFSRADIYDDHD